MRGQRMAFFAIMATAAIILALAPAFERGDTDETEDEAMNNTTEPEPSAWLLPTVNDTDEHGFESALNAPINAYATRGLTDRTGRETPRKSPTMARSDEDNTGLARHMPQAERKHPHVRDPIQIHENLFLRQKRKKPRRHAPARHRGQRARTENTRERDHHSTGLSEPNRQRTGSYTSAPASDAFDMLEELAEHRTKQTMEEHPTRATPTDTETDAPLDAVSTIGRPTPTVTTIAARQARPGTVDGAHIHVTPSNAPTRHIPA